jgi:hypothetical protein
MKKRLACAGLLLLTFAPADAGAQQQQQQQQQQQPRQRECFDVAMTSATGGGSLGSILVERHLDTSLH